MAFERIGKWDRANGGATPSVSFQTPRNNYQRIRINRGACDAFGLKVGDRIDFEVDRDAGMVRIVRSDVDGRKLSRYADGLGLNVGTGTTRRMGITMKYVVAPDVREDGVYFPMPDKPAMALASEAVA